jgi:hypothetical protein
MPLTVTNDATIQSQQGKALKLHRKLRERYRVATGAVEWPQTGRLWDTGIVTGVSVAGTTTTITDSTKTWVVAGEKRWTSFARPAGDPLELAPAAYDIHLWPEGVGTNEASPWQVIPLQITDNGTTTVTCNMPLTDWVTTKQIAAYTDVVGWRYKIVKRTQYNWADRWFFWQNFHEYWWGKADGGLTDATHIEDLGRVGHPYGRYWAVDELVGKEVVFVGTDGLHHRCTITANTYTRMTFTNASGIAPTAGYYCVVTAGGGPVRPDRHGRKTTTPYPHWSAWYGGVGYDVWTCHPDQNALPPSFANRPFGPQRIGWQTRIGWQEKNAGVCTVDYPVPKYAWDIDIQVPWDHPCVTPRDNVEAPDFYATPRGLWVAAYDLCRLYAEDNTHEGSKSIRNYVPATMLWKGGVNAWTSTTGSLVSPVSGASTQIALDAAMTLPAGVTTPVQVEFAVRNVRDVVVGSHGVPGTNGIYNNPVGGTSSVAGQHQYGTISGSFGSYVLTFADASPTGAQVFTTNHENMPAVFSLGPTRRVPYLFKYLYPRTTWFPQSDGLGGVAPIDPATPGGYVARAASTQYVEPDEYGDLQAAGAFVTNIVGVYLGDTAADAARDIFGKTRDGSSGGTLPFDAAYRAASMERAPGKTTRAAYRLSLYGTATAAGTSWLQDDAKDWSDDAPITGTGLAHLSGTGGVGSSTTSIKDTTHAGSALWTTGFLVGQVVQVNDGSGNWHRRAVTAANVATQVLTLSAALPFDATGKAYKIIPQIVRNRWEQRTVKGVMTNGVAYTGTIQYSDDKALFYTPASAFPLVTYEIVEELPGSTWQWDGTKHVQPSAAYHTAGRTAGAPVAGKFYNHPNIKTRYGLPRKYDITSDNHKNWRDELFDCLDKLKSFFVTHNWLHDPTDVDATNNFPNTWHSQSSCTYDCWSGCSVYDPLHPTTTGDAVSSNDYFYGQAAGSENDAHPYAYSIGFASRSPYPTISDPQTTHGYSVSSDFRFAYGKFNLGYSIDKVVSACTFDFYDYGIIPVQAGDANDHGQGPDTDTTDNDRRQFNLSCSIDARHRQMHLWSSVSTPSGSGLPLASTSLSLDGSGNPLSCGTAAKTQPANCPAPTPLDNSTSHNVYGVDVTEATVLVTPTFAH